MSPLLKKMLGNDSKDQKLTEDMRAVLAEMQQERARFEELLQTSEGSAERLRQVTEPIARTDAHIKSLSVHVDELETRFAQLAQGSVKFSFLGERADQLAKQQQAAEAEVANAIAAADKVRAMFDEISGKVDAALALKDRLGSFLEIEKPFQQLRDEAQSVREQVDGASDLLTRLREQQDRLMDANKLTMQKMEALDRRRDVLGRELTDKERRVASVEQAVRGMDGIQNTVDDVKREINTLKALSDTVVQKTAALEAQREAVDRALSTSATLDQAMRQLDQGVRQQQDNEIALKALAEQVATVRALHESVAERSGEISQIQREADELTKAAREDMASMTEEMRKTVERFDFESHGLESVTQRVTDLRALLSDFESRFKTLSESRQEATELKTQVQASASQMQQLASEVGKVEREMGQLRAIRRDLDEASRTAKTLGTQTAKLDEALPTIKTALEDVKELSGTHALVTDTLERTRVVHEELAQFQSLQGETRSWIDQVGRTVAELRDQVGELNGFAPSVAQAQSQAQRISESLAEFEARRASIEELQRKIAEMAELGANLDERGHRIEKRMETTESKFESFESHAEEAERLGHSIGTVTANLREAGRKSEDILKTVAAITARCESVEALEERARALHKDLAQREEAMAAAAKDLQKATDLRQKAAAQAQKLGELNEELSNALASADERTVKIGSLANDLEARAANLETVEERLTRFEGRLAQWDHVEDDLSRSLDQIVSRQGTLEAVQSDLDRMLEMAEKTAQEVRAITSSRQEIEQSRKLLDQVLARMGELRETANGLDERKRQMTKAEERLARAEALLVDVGSSLESLQSQKALVDQAVEKAGSLQFLLKQAESTIGGLREEREITSRVRDAVAVHQDRDGGAQEAGSQAA